MYKRQIYRIAESNRIETFFAELECSTVGSRLCSLLSCEHACHPSPLGGVCYCQQGFQLDPTDSRTCQGKQQRTTLTSIASRCCVLPQSHFISVRRPPAQRRYNITLIIKAGVKSELLDTVKARKLAYYGHTMRKQGSCLEKEIMQGTMPGARRRGRPRRAWMDNIKTWTGLSVEESIRMTDGWSRV